MENNEEKLESSKDKDCNCGCKGNEEKKSSSCKSNCSCNNNTINKANAELADLIRLDTL